MLIGFALRTPLPFKISWHLDMHSLKAFDSDVLGILDGAGSSFGLALKALRASQAPRVSRRNSARNSLYCSFIFLAKSSVVQLFTVQLPSYQIAF